MAVPRGADRRADRAGRAGHGSRGHPARGRLPAGAPARRPRRQLLHPRRPHGAPLRRPHMAGRPGELCCPPSSPRSAPCQPPASRSQHHPATAKPSPAPRPQATAPRPRTSRKAQTANPARVPGHRHVLQPGLTTPRSSTGLWITSAALLVDSGQIQQHLASYEHIPSRPGKIITLLGTKVPAGRVPKASSRPLSPGLPPRTPVPSQGAAPPVLSPRRTMCADPSSDPPWDTPDSVAWRVRP